MEKVEMYDHTKTERERQEEEIATIKERNITVKLSDADCERLMSKCGEHGLSAGELIAYFVGDLVDGTYSNGSDERDLANRWFERCWFAMYPENTLLSHLLDWGYKPEDYLDAMDNIKKAKKDKKYIEEHPEAADGEEPDWIDDDIAYWEEELKYMTRDWKTAKESDMDKEIGLIKQWVKEREELLKEEKEDRERKVEGQEHQDKADKEEQTDDNIYVHRNGRKR